MSFGGLQERPGTVIFFQTAPSDSISISSNKAVIVRLSYVCMVVVNFFYCQSDINIFILLGLSKGSCHLRFSGIRPLRGGWGYPPFPLRKKTFFFSHWFSVKGGVGVPPNSAKEKNLLFRSKNSIFCLFYAFLALFGPLYGLFGPFLTLFNEKNIIFSPFRKKFPGKA